MVLVIMGGTVEALVSPHLLLMAGWLLELKIQKLFHDFIC